MSQKDQEDDTSENVCHRKIERMSCDTSENVCWDLHNWCYCFYQWDQNVFDVSLTDNFQYQSQFLCIRVLNWPNIFVDQIMFNIKSQFLCIQVLNWPNIFVDQIIFNIRVSSCVYEFWTDLIFLWVKFSSVIQTLSAPNIKGKISNLLITGNNMLVAHHERMPFQ